MEEIIVHQYKLRFAGDYYKALVTGSKYEAEKYIKTRFKPDEMIWEKSFATTKDIAIHIGTGNKTIVNQGFFLRMEYLCQFTTKRNTSLNNKPRNFSEIKTAIKEDNKIKFTIRELRKSQHISSKELAGELFIKTSYLNRIEKGKTIPDEDLKDMISNYLNVDKANIDWQGEKD